MSQREHVGKIWSLFCRCNKNSVGGSSSWDVWKIRYCAVHQPLFNKLIFKRCVIWWMTQVHFEKKEHRVLPLAVEPTFCLLSHSVLSGFHEDLPILLGGERHCEWKVFCPRTQHNDPARTRTQTSRPRVQRTTIRPHASPTSGLDLRKLHT